MPRRRRVKQTGESVAVKLINLEEAEDEIDDIQKEIAMISACNSDYVTRYHASCVYGTTLWIVMEFVDGGSVLDVMQTTSLRESEMAVILREVLRGLHYLHSEGKIHRDIKGVRARARVRGRMARPCTGCRQAARPELAGGRVRVRWHWPGAARRAQPARGAAARRRAAAPSAPPRRRRGASARAALRARPLTFGAGARCDGVAPRAPVRPAPAQRRTSSSARRAR